jgi:serine/threonine protein kinase
MFQAGQKIGPYTLDRALGEGSYGVVWLAEERTGLIQRHVALKLPKDVEPDIDAIRREAETWLRAGKHSNVVQVLHADIYDGQVAIATEYIEGGSLHERLRQQQGGPIDTRCAVEMTRGILAGLHHLHSLPPRPLVHRDLKPGNVLLRGDVPLLTDFGLTRVFSSTAFTQAGGTPAYMPPEAFDDRFSPQTDIWAAGVTLYRMLKGELPFPQREFSALIGAILNKEPDPLPVTVPWPLQAVVLRALMKDPGHRFGTAEEMRNALGRALADTAGAHGGPIASLPAPDRRLTEFDITATRAMPQAAAPIGPPVANRKSDVAAPSSTPQVPALAVIERPAPGYSEALTAVPERPASPQSLTQRADDLLQRLSGNTTTFCGALLASAPIWGLYYSVDSLLERMRILDAVPTGFFLLAGSMSLIFARLGWHRYAWMPPKSRRHSAIKFAVLGFASGAIIPVIVVAFVIALSSMTGTSSGSPPPEGRDRELPPPPSG